MNIRPVEKKDAFFASEIEKSSLSVPWKKEDIENFSENPSGAYFVAEEGNEIIGICGAYMGAGECMITNIAVKSEFRNRGVGFCLMKRLLAEAKARNCNTAFLEVASGNTGAIRFYEKFNFEIYGRRKNYYRDDDACLMKSEDL